MVKARKIENLPFIHPMLKPGEGSVANLRSDLPKPEITRPDEERVPCPKCKAGVGEPCVEEGKPITTWEGFVGRVPTVHIRRMEVHADADLDGFGKRLEELSR